MLSIQQIKSAVGAVQYYLSNAIENYYFGITDVLTRWRGSAAKMLSLDGNVQPEQLQHSFKGFSPDGKNQLVQNAGSETRQSGLDLTLSAPKPFSVLYAFAPEELQPSILKQHHDAVDATLKAAEELCGFSRRGQGGKLLERAAVAFACVTHFTSRALEMAVHDHCLMPNIGIRLSDKTTGTLYSNRFFELKLFLGKFYRDQLAQNLQQNLGLTIEPQKVGFQIKGIPKAICSLFSSRRNAIVREMNEQGFVGGAASKVAALATREKKRQLSIKQLLPIWEQVAAKQGFGRTRIENLLANGQLQMTCRTANKENEGFKRNGVPPARDVAPEPSPTIPKKAIGKQFTRTVPPQIERASQSRSKNFKPRNSQNGSSSKRDSDYARRAADFSFNDVIRAEAKARLHAGKTAQAISKVNNPKKWIRVEKHLLFPKAPEWSPLKKLALSKIVVGRMRKSRGWREIIWKRGNKAIQLRVQEKQMFPNAPAWSPMNKVKARALRVLTPAALKRIARAKMRAIRNEQRLSHSH